MSKPLNWEEELIRNTFEREKKSKVRLSPLILPLNNDEYSKPLRRRKDHPISVKNLGYSGVSVERT